MLPILIPPKSEFSCLITSQYIWSGQSLDIILDSVFEGKSGSIEVQDHGLAFLTDFIVTKSSNEVQSRFFLDLNDRGCPWNCLEVDDQLLGFKSPQLL